VAVEEVVWMVEEAEEVVGRVALKVARVGMAALVVEVNLEVILEAEAAPEVMEGANERSECRHLLCQCCHSRCRW